MTENTKTIDFPNSFINSIDWEHEAQKDLVYLQEEMHEFYRSLNDPGIAQIDAFLSDKVYFCDLDCLQERARINVCIPESLIAKIDRKIIRNYERKIDALSF
jgi:hypothetical protein